MDYATFRGDMEMHGGHAELHVTQGVAHLEDRSGTGGTVSNR